MKLIQKAVIKQGDKYLIGLRSEQAKYFPLHWDFPGGKLEPGEDPFEGIVREVKEETDLNVRALEVVGAYQWWVLQLSDEHLEDRWATQEEIMKLSIEPYFAPFFQEHT